MERVQKVFGIVSISPAIVIDSEIKTIEENAIEQVRSTEGIKTFKITAKRGIKPSRLNHRTVFAVWAK